MTLLIIILPEGYPFFTCYLVKPLKSDIGPSMDATLKFLSVGRSAT